MRSPCFVAFILLSIIICHSYVVSCWSTIPSKLQPWRRSASSHHRREIIQQYNSNGDGDNESKVSSDENEQGPAIPVRRLLLSYALAAGTEYVLSQNFVRPGFKRLHPMQFFAALGDPQSQSGVGAEKWGVWESGDPGPRGIPFDQFDDIVSNGKKSSPVGWEIDPKSFWLEEHGIWMEAPRYNLQPGRYLVTGGRLRTSVLTIEPADENGVKKWSLDGGVLYDVTHLPCRSALYVDEGNGGSPLNARREDFPVKPGGEMPQVQGCEKQDYAVLFVTGVEDV
eukprot:CAMPEP_0201694404 /NCGR_PEP_ID=MMETSP0578-20130828/6699_1 /ASSEMBLY_ACC=CAM_ASM_000663 /TAXON_ID=267565 /ORGANISM="Skeletonema grethea, Strain CCMP 1804" /LENGTH=281 /DNA_ID=CAMNT_0048180089 /DNA_START=137 /DNA_END=982 /DNA_ORIENTATION=+